MGPMNFDEMILAHTRWKMRFRGFILAPKEELDGAIVGRDDQCEMGKWIHNEGKKHAGLSEYETVKTVHADFHVAAAAVVSEVRAGSLGKALAMLDHVSGAFGRASARRVAAIAALKDTLSGR